MFADSTGYTNIYLTRVLLYFSALGEGWAPAILNSPEELDFIRQGQLWFSDDRSYWLGGSTNTQPWEHIDLSDYNTGDSGNRFFPKYSIVVL